MTLQIFQSDIISQYPSRGVQEIDPQNDTMFRNKLIEKLDYLSKTSKNINAIDAYIWCKEELNKRSKKIEDIMKEVESKIAETKIMLKQTENDKQDENIYKEAIKAYDLFLTYLKDKK
jgi:hypothetical protein